MKDKLKVYFADFWPGFYEDNNFLLDALQPNFSIDLTDSNPDIIFFSDFGNDNWGYPNSTRIYFSGENWDVSERTYDYALTWRYIESKNHFRLPLHIVYSLRKKIENSEPFQSKVDKFKQKKGLCCFVISNSNSSYRNDFIKELSKYAHLSSGGSYMNNVGGPVKDKMSFIEDYQFVLSFENSEAEGYTTEKIVQPLMKGCIPIYWGNPLIEKDIHSDAMLNIRNFNSPQEVARYMESVGNNEDLIRKHMSAPWFPDNRNPEDYRTNLEDFLKRVNTRVSNKQKLHNTLVINKLKMAQRLSRLGNKFQK